MANIDGTLPGQSVQALSVDQDIAMDYSVSTTSVLGSTPVADSDTAYGVSPALANLITEAKNAWMTEYGGDYRKIPLIITTDQHGRTNPQLFSLLGKTLSIGVDNGIFFDIVTILCILFVNFLLRRMLFGGYSLTFCI